MAKKKRPEKVVNKQGQKEKYDSMKLYSSIYYPALESGYEEEEADEFANSVCKKVADWASDQKEAITTREMREEVLKELRKRDKDVAFMYETHLDVN